MNDDISAIELQTDFEVELVQSEGDDEMICRAARVSTLAADSLETTESEGLINFLMKNRHGTPFEHGMMTFRINAPIFVWREFMRHRIGFSYNEQSGRYMEMRPVFYVPTDMRPLIQVGKPGAYSFELGTYTQYDTTMEKLEDAYLQSWKSYQEMLQAGISKEVARMCLPLSIYSCAYVTCNPRSLMSFLSLRTRNASSMFPSYPQWEIEQVASKMESIFWQLYPITHNSFQLNGRVSP